MFIVQPAQWNNSHTDLSKYFIEKVKQKVDYEETISNRHKTSNGYTLIKEIIEVATLAQKRIKSVRRLISLVNEAKSKLLSSSIINDYILKQYHSDIIDYFERFNSNKLGEGSKELVELLNKSKIFSIRLDNEYILNIKTEINRIDFRSSNFERNAVVLDQIIDCLIPYLLYKGYSVTGISNVAYRFIKKDSGVAVARRFLYSFNSDIKPYHFLIKYASDSVEITEIENYLNSRKVSYKTVTLKEVESNLFDDFVLGDTEKLILISHSTLDPHNYLRNLYEMSLKNYVISKDRLNLDFFTNFFETAFWRFDIQTHKFQKSNISLDQINVKKRKSTLRSTLETLNQSFKLDFDSNSRIPYISEIKDCLYYYNLALGSKSIENSLSLLWTCLETLLPYRMKDNDIENVQYFVSKSLSIGVIGRDITSFASRFLATGWQNSNCFDDLGMYTTYLNYSPEGIKKWIYWLIENYEEEGKKDPFDSIKPVSNLLCKIFCDLNNVYNGKEDSSVNYWLEKLKKSEAAIDFQLDRIYLHRNQIVHSGKFINEYSNLWNHLEWYVGKLLSYCVLRYITSDEKDSFSKEKIFMELEADYDLLLNFLQNNKDKSIKEVQFIYSLISKHTWQFF